MNVSPAVKLLSDKNLIKKTASGAFVTLLAPALVAFGVKYSDGFVEKIEGKPEAAKTEPSPKNPEAAAANVSRSDIRPETLAASALPALPAPPAVIVLPALPVSPVDFPEPSELAIAATNFQSAGPIVRLFNLKDLSGWYKHFNKAVGGDAAQSASGDRDGVFRAM